MKVREGLLCAQRNAVGIVLGVVPPPQGEIAPLGPKNASARDPEQGLWFLVFGTKRKRFRGKFYFGPKPDLLHMLTLLFSFIRKKLQKVKQIIR